MVTLIISLSLLAVEFEPNPGSFNSQLKTLTNQTLVVQTKSKSECHELAKVVERNFKLSTGMATTIEAERYLSPIIGKKTQTFTGISYECL